MISSEEIRNKLEGYPEKLFTHYEQFLQDKDPEQLNYFVIGLLRFLQDATETTETPADNTNLREELDVDSITIAEIVFQLEDIFEIEIDNQDLMQINTIGDLKTFLMGKLT